MGRRAEDLRVLINPEFVEREGMQLEEEGLSERARVHGDGAAPQAGRRPRAGSSAAREHFVEGKELLARALQHEIDHLDGMLFVDRLRGIKRRHIVRQIQKLRRTGRW